jgi:hypothetical protein
MILVLEVNFSKKNLPSLSQFGDMLIVGVGQKIL